jgi:hypothetical protein
MATAAKRPESRTVTVNLPEPWVGWTATLRVTFPLKRLQDLQSGDFDRIAEAWDAICVEHNFPDDEGGVAASAATVCDYDAVGKAITLWSEAMATLPPR